MAGLGMTRKVHTKNGHLLGVWAKEPGVKPTKGEIKKMARVQQYTNKTAKIPIGEETRAGQLGCRENFKEWERV